MNRIAIRRETDPRWKQCAPLVPKDVMLLVAEGIPLAIQPSPHRVFIDDAYAAAGAAVREDIDRAHLIMGVAAIDANDVDAPRAWMLFSGVTDGDQASLSMLEAILDKGATLLDYDLIVDDDGQHLVHCDCLKHHDPDTPLSESTSMDNSRRFSEALHPFIPSLANADFSADTLAQSELSPILQNACIAWRGSLTPSFEELEVSL